MRRRPFRKIETVTDLWREAGESLIERGDKEEAVDYYRCLLSEGQNVHEQMVSAYLSFNMAGSIDDDVEDDFRDMSEAYELIIFHAYHAALREPDNKKLWMDLADHYIAYAVGYPEGGETYNYFLDMGIKTYRQLVYRDPEDLSPLAYIAYNYYLLGMRDSALAAIDEILELRPLEELDETTRHLLDSIWESWGKDRAAS